MSRVKHFQRQKKIEKIVDYRTESQDSSSIG